MKFFTNLRPKAVIAFKAHGYKPKAWLLSSHRLNKRALRYAHYVRKKGVPLFADNRYPQIL